MSLTARIFRPTAFRWGLLTGGGLFLLLAAGFYALSFAGPAYDVELIANGADVSRAGGRRIVVRDENRKVFTAECNGVCDDLWYGYSVGGDTTVSVEVRDAEGRCVACDPTGAYTSGGYPYLIERWTLAGPKLDAAPKTIVPR